MTSIAAMTWYEPVETWARSWPDSLPRRTPEAEARLLEEVRCVVTELQSAARRDGPPGRALHARGIYATARARLTIGWWVRAPIALGPFVPDAAWSAVVRFSNASPAVQPDDTADQRGLAVRITDGDRRLDLLTTTGEAHHARDAEGLLTSLRAAKAALRGGVAGQLGAVGTLVGELGLKNGIQMARTVSGARQAGVSLAGLTFYSRAPFQLGPYAVRYRFTPVPGADATLHGEGTDALRTDLLGRLAKGPVQWSFQLQGFLDPVRTPMDDHRVAWDSPWVPIGHLALDAGERDAAAALAETDAVSAATSFRIDPAWPDPAGPVLLPLGDLNRLRGAAYEASEAGRR